MSTSLRDLLKQKAAQYAIESDKNRLLIEEWQAAVQRLFTQLEAWLAAADPEGIIMHKRSQFEVSEPSLGNYTISRLNLRAFGRWVSLIPKARRTGRRTTPPRPSAPEQSTGRVDITNEINSHMLYRFGQGAEEYWLIDDIDANTGMQPLTAERFEAALLGYFQ